MSRLVPRNFHNTFLRSVKVGQTLYLLDHCNQQGDWYSVLDHRVCHISIVQCTVSLKKEIIGIFGMDALAGYGSSDSSDSSNQEVGNSGTKTGISGLIGHYSDDSDDDEQNKVTAHTVHHAPQPGVSGGPISEVVKKGVQNGDAQEVNDGGEEKQQVDGQPKKRQRRWDVDMTTNNTINIDSLLPAPTLLSSSTDPFQSMTLFDKDHTTELRQKLAEQLQTQTQAQEGKLASTEKQQQLTKKLEQLYGKFQQNHQPDGSSFAAHLKSSHEFG